MILELCWVHRLIASDFENSPLRCKIICPLTESLLIATEDLLIVTSAMQSYAC